MPVCDAAGRLRQQAQDRQGRHRFTTARLTQQGEGLTPLDAEIQADVYLAMTGGQANLSLGGEVENGQPVVDNIRRLPERRNPLPVPAITQHEEDAHQARLKKIEDVSAGKCLWLQLDAPE